MTNILGFATGLERPSPRLVIALGLGTAGVLSIFSITSADRTGLLLALSAALAVAIYFLAAQVIMRGVPATVSATWTSLGAAGVLGATSLLSGQNLPVAALPSAGALGIATIVAFVGLYAAIGKIGSSRASIAQMLEPVVTVLLGALVLSEKLTWRIGIGAALIVSSLPMLVRTGHQEEIPPPADSL
jgi:drug/metabolite transporter (DMT)-like permease